MVKGGFFKLAAQRLIKKDKDRKKKIALSLKYQVLTRGTAFVGVDKGGNRIRPIRTSMPQTATIFATRPVGAGSIVPVVTGKVAVQTVPLPNVLTRLHAKMRNAHDHEIEKGVRH